MNTDRVIKKTVTVYKSYKEDGTLDYEETTEVLEYEKLPSGLPPASLGQYWWQNPIVSSDTIPHVKYTPMGGMP